MANIQQVKIAEGFKGLDPAEFRSNLTDKDVLFGPRKDFYIDGTLVGYTIADEDSGIGVFAANDNRLGTVTDEGAAKPILGRWYLKSRSNGGTPNTVRSELADEETPPDVDRTQLEAFIRVLFKHATAGNWISLRAFFEDRPDLKPFKIAPIKLNGNFDGLIDQAQHLAERAAHHPEKLVFCPPTATFTSNKHAREQDLAEGLVLSTECDKAATAAQMKLETVLGAATLVVASGGEWMNPVTGEVEPKLHTHHRLKVPKRNRDEHRMLKEARRLAAMLVGADKSNVPICHPIRWPGSLHRKKEPKLCRIVACNGNAEIDLAWALMKLREAVEAEGLGAEIISFKSRTAKATGENTGPTNPNNLRAPCIEAVIAALAIIPNDNLDWDEWNYVGLATQGATGGSDEGGRIFATWSAKSKEKNDPATTAARWEHFATSPPDRIGFGTLVYLARKVRPDWDPPSKPARSLFDIDANEGPPPISWDPASLRISYSNIPHRGWLYGPYLIRGEVTVIAAPGGVGKTALTTGIATAIVTGMVLMDDKIWGTDLKVLSINGEDGKAEVTRRMWAFAKAHAHQIAVEAPDRFYAIGADDDRIQQISFLQTNEKNRTTLDSNGFAVLESLIAAVHPDVVILDPLVVFCGGGDMNGPVMAQVIRKLKKLAIQYNYANLIVHHNRKGGEQGDQESIANAAAIVNLARCAIMPVPMTAQEAPKLGVLPSERHRYFRLVNAKPNFTPKSEDSPWYQLHSIELPNAEPPTYEHGDNVQAVVRIQLPLPKTTGEAADDRKIQKALLDLIDRGKLIEGQRCPYSPNITGAKNMRGLLEDALTAVAAATVGRHWRPGDLRAIVQITIDKMTVDRWITEEEIKKGRFRRKFALHVKWQNTPWSNGASAGRPEGGPGSGDGIFDDELDHELAELLGRTAGEE